MKKLIAAALAAITIAGANYYKTEDLYGLTAVVTDITDDTVTCVDLNGNEWQFTGAEDWFEGDIAALVMFDNGTPEIKDDEVVTASYCGWTENV